LYIVRDSSAGRAKKYSEVAQTFCVNSSNTTVATAAEGAREIDHNRPASVAA
jgi:hypothetical protein